MNELIYSVFKLYIVEIELMENLGAKSKTLSLVNFLYFRSSKKRDPSFGFYFMEPPVPF